LLDKEAGIRRVCLARLGSSISLWDAKPVDEQGASRRFLTDNPNGCLGQ
jgi:hypothetical protein